MIETSGNNVEQRQHCVLGVVAAPALIAMRAIEL